MRKLKSMGLQEFLTEIEKHAYAEDQNPTAFVEQFLERMEANRTIYLEKAMADIKEAELSPYEKNQREKKRK